MSQIQGRAEFFDRNSCTFGHKLGKRLIGDYHRCASKVVLSPFVFVAFRFPSSCFILAHLFLHPFPMASLALSGACLWFRRFFRCLLHVRSYVFSLVVISLWLTHLWFLTQAYGVSLQNLNTTFELKMYIWVLKCISFWHSNLPTLKQSICWQRVLVPNIIFNIDKFNRQCSIFEHLILNFVKFWYSIIMYICQCHCDYFFEFNYERNNFNLQSIKLK